METHLPNRILLSICTLQTLLRWLHGFILAAPINIRKGGVSSVLHLESIKPQLIASWSMQEFCCIYWRELGCGSQRPLCHLCISLDHAFHAEIGLRCHIAEWRWSCVVVDAAAAAAAYSMGPRAAPVSHARNAAEENVGVMSLLPKTGSAMGSVRQAARLRARNKRQGGIFRRLLRSRVLIATSFDLHMELLERIYARKPPRRLSFDHLHPRLPMVLNISILGLQTTKGCGEKGFQTEYLVSKSRFWKSH